MKNSKYCVFIILITQLPLSFIHGVTTIAMNTPTPAIMDFINQSYTVRFKEVPDNATVTLVMALVQSTLIWGTLVGSLLVQPTLRILSARKSVILIHVINILSAIFSGPVAKYTFSYESLIIGRILAGIANGLGYTIVMIIVAEFTARSDMGIFQTPFQVFIDVSGAFSAGIGHHQALGNAQNWIWIVCIPIVASIVYFSCCPWIPESPVSLLRNRKRKGALEILKELRKDNVDIEAEVKAWESEIREELTASAVPLRKILTDNHLLFQFLTVVITTNAFQLVGMLAILMYSNDILLRAGIDQEYVTFVSMSMNLMAVLSFTAYLPMQRKTGTKRVFVAGTAICCSSLLVFTIANGLSAVGISWISYLAVAATCCYMFGVYLGPVLCQHSLQAELTTATSRPTIAFYSTSLFWAIGAITTLVFPYSIDALNTYAFVPFLIFAFLLIPFGVFIIPETHKRSNAQIQNSFRKKSSKLTRKASKFSESKCDDTSKGTGQYANDDPNEAFDESD